MSELKERMANKLKELYSNLGFSQEVLTSVTESAIDGLSSDVDDAAIESRAKAFGGMLKSFQTNTERRVTEAVRKATDEKVKGGKPEEPTPSDEPAWFKAYRESQEQKSKSLEETIARLEGENKSKQFDQLVSRVSKEFGLSSSVLDLVKQGLSADMDEKSIRDYLGKAKKTLIDAGAKISDEERPAEMSKSEKDRMRSEAAEWVKAEAARQSK